MKTIKGYKAYDKGLVCKGFQYEVGKEYKYEGELKICNSGFHFCKNPLDILDYYDLTECEFTEVEALGKIVDEKDKDSKIATNHIKIGAKLDLSAFIKCSIDFLFENIGHKTILDKAKQILSKKSSGDYSQLASSGNSSKLASSGNSSQLASSGNSSQLAINGNDSVGANIGIEGKIKGKKGNWITLAEYDSSYKPIYVKSAQIDGKEIEEDTWYILKDKKFTKYE